MHKQIITEVKPYALCFVSLATFEQLKTWSMQPSSIRIYIMYLYII